MNQCKGTSGINLPTNLRPQRHKGCMYVRGLKTVQNL